MVSCGCMAGDLQYLLTGLMPSDSPCCPDPFAYTGLHYIQYTIHVPCTCPYQFLPVAYLSQVHYLPRLARKDVMELKRLS